jgi:hypothetical protein
VQLLATIVPLSAKFNYTKVFEGHKHEWAWFLEQFGIVEAKPVRLSRFQSQPSAIFPKKRMKTVVCLLAGNEERSE